MNVGRMRDRALILVRGATEDTHGQASDTYTEVDTVPCEHVEFAGRLLIESMAGNSSIIGTARIRTRTGLVPKETRVQINGGQIFDVDAIQSRGRRHQWQLLMLSAVGQVAA